jgi:hypothetical protein
VDAGAGGGDRRPRVRSRRRDVRHRQRRERLGLRLEQLVGAVQRRLAGCIGSQSGPSAGQPWRRQRSDETPLTGDALSKVTAAAKAKVPGGTIVRVETDADGNSAYEAHMVKADGTPVTVYVNKQFDVVSVESGMSGPPGRAPAQSSSGASA